MPRHQQAATVSPNRPLTVEIPPGFDATMATARAVYDEDATSCSRADAAAATEADIKLGERTAFIPMTCQERQVLDRLEAGLQSAAGLWRDSPQQQEHDQLLSSALHHWRAAGSAAVSTSWVWEVGRWSTQFSLPLALELRRLDPAAMADSDQLLALSTCLRNRQIDLAKRLAAAAAAAPASNDSATTTTSTSTSSGRKKAPPLSSLDEHQLDDEPCLCQIRWGLAPDTEAAKRRQLEKLEKLGEDRGPAAAPVPLTAARKLSPPHRLQKLPHRHQYKQQQQQQHQQQHQHLRPIVKTSHLRDEHQLSPEPPAAAFAADDAGYGSQNCSPASAAAAAAGGGFISGLLASSGSGGRGWAD